MMMHHETFDKSIQTVTIQPYTKQEFESGPPHESLFLVLPYLSVFELLAVSEVCTALRDAATKDVLPWLEITIDKPLNTKLSDKILFKLASKANGRLKALALFNCAKITDDGLQRVVERNPLINKLYLPGCTGLTPDGIVRAMKTLSNQNNALKNLHINGIYNITKQHLETICFYLSKVPMPQKSKPILYHNYIRSFATGEKENADCMIDVEVCPKCGEVRMVFDCPKETCLRKKKGRTFNHCRGCYFCIQRCEECGGCVEIEEVEESVCAGIVCLTCWLHLPKCNCCNKPYCRRHADEQPNNNPDRTSVCEVCRLRVSGNKYDVEFFY